MNILLYFWPPAETYCQNIVILGERKIKSQNPLYESNWIFLGSRNGKNSPPKKLKILIQSRAVIRFLGWAPSKNKLLAFLKEKNK
jgi:hypothetical protein